MKSFMTYILKLAIKKQQQKKNRPKMIALVGPHTHLLVTEYPEVMTLFWGHPEILKEEKI